MSFFPAKTLNLVLQNITNDSLSRGHWVHKTNWATVLDSEEPTWGLCSKGVSFENKHRRIQVDLSSTECGLQ